MGFPYPGPPPIIGPPRWNPPSPPDGPQSIVNSLDRGMPSHGRDNKEILAARDLVKRQTLRRRKCYNQEDEPGIEVLIRPLAMRECVYYVFACCVSL